MAFVFEEETTQPKSRFVFEEDTDSSFEKEAFEQVMLPQEQLNLMDTLGRAKPEEERKAPPIPKWEGSVGSFEWDDGKMVRPESGWAGTIGKNASLAVPGFIKSVGGTIRAVEEASPASIASAPVNLASFVASPLKYAGLPEPEQFLKKVADTIENKAPAKFKEKIIGGVEELAGIQPGAIGKGIFDYGKKVEEAWSPDVKPGTMKAQVGGAIRSVAINLPMIASAIVTKNPNIALQGLGWQSGAEQYGEQRDKGQSPGRSLAAAEGYRHSEIWTEKIPMGVLLNPKYSLGKRLILSQIAEQPGEAAATTLQNGVIDVATTRPETTWGEYKQAIVDTFIQTAIATPILSSASHPMVNWATKQQSKVVNEIANEGHYKTLSDEELTALSENTKSLVELRPKDKGLKKSFDTFNEEAKRRAETAPETVEPVAQEEQPLRSQPIPDPILKSLTDSGDLNNALGMQTKLKAAGAQDPRLDSLVTGLQKTAQVKDLKNHIITQGITGDYEAKKAALIARGDVTEDELNRAIVDAYGAKPLDGRPVRSMGTVEDIHLPTPALQAQPEEIPGPETSVPIPPSGEPGVSSEILTPRVIQNESGVGLKVEYSRNGEVVGSGQLLGEDITNIIVEEPYRRQGIGSEIMKDLMERGGKSGYAGTEAGVGLMKKAGMGDLGGGRYGIEEAERYGESPEQEPFTDENYWGGRIAEIVKDPRNITKEEWTKLDPIYQQLQDAGDEYWQGAKAVAEKISLERGDIIEGPGEKKIKLNYPVSKPEPVAPEPVEEKKVKSFPKEYSLSKPIKGNAGAEIVGYNWISHVEEVDGREGDIVLKRVSNWDSPSQSTGTGRAIVHEYFVKHPDGSITVEGINSAQNILGISETRLQTIAKNERRAREYKAGQDKLSSESFDKSASDTTAEASRKYRKLNSSPMRSFEENDKIFQRSVIITKNGKFARTQPENIEGLKKWGWSEHSLPSAPEPDLPVKQGQETTVSTNRTRGLKVQYALADIGDLRTSHSDSLNLNKDYPQELQNRNRGRLASEEQIGKIIANPDPSRLADNPMAQDGAPIVTDKGVIISGNARTIALRRMTADNPEGRKAYTDWLKENAERFGLKSEDVTDASVLVRVNKSDMDLVKFAQEANEPTIATLSPSEQALTDSSKISTALMDVFAPNDEGNLLVGSNQEFVRGFIRDVVNPNELNSVTTKEGDLSQAGVNRIRNALFAKVYEDVSVLEKLAESTDNNIRNITNGMLASISKIAKMKQGIEDGLLYPVDITDDILRAMQELADIRSKGITYQDYLSQLDMFDTMAPEAKAILGVFSEYSRSPKKIAAFFNTYADTVLKSPKPDKNQIDLFKDLGDNVVPTKESVLRSTIEELEERYGTPKESVSQTDLFPEVPPAGGKPVKGKSQKGITPKPTWENPNPKPGRGAEEVEAAYPGLLDEITQHFKDKLGIKENDIRDALKAFGSIANQLTFDFSVPGEPGKVSRPGRPSKSKAYRIIGHGFTESLIKYGSASYTGRTITKPSDLAKLAQVFRNPKFETLRFFYTKGDKIVGHEGITSRMPGEVSFAPTRDIQGAGKYVKEQVIPRIKVRMSRLGADGFWTVHNHPSGEVLASREDVAMHQKLDTDLDLKFKGGIIINGGKFGLLQRKVRNGNFFIDFSEEELLTEGPDNLLTPSVKHPLLGININSPETLAILSSALKTEKDMVTAIYLSSKNDIRAIQEVPIGLFKNYQGMVDYFRGRLREFGARNVAPVFAAGGIPEDVRQNVRNGILDGRILDAAQIGTGKSARTHDPELMQASTEGFFAKETPKSYRVAEGGEQYSVLPDYDQGDLNAQFDKWLEETVKTPPGSTEGQAKVFEAIAKNDKIIHGAGFNRDDLSVIRSTFDVPWWIAKDYKDVKKVVNIEVARQAARSKLTTEFLQSPTKKRAGEFHEYLDLSAKKSEELFQKAIIPSDAFIKRNEAGEIIQSGRVMPAAELDKLGLDESQKVAYYAYKRSMDKVWQRVTDHAQEMLWRPYKDEPWVDLLKDVINGDLEAEAAINAAGNPADAENLTKALAKLEKPIGRLKELRLEFEKLKFYSPRVREQGDYVVSVRDKKGTLIHSERTKESIRQGKQKKEADEIAERLQKQYPDHTVRADPQQRTTEEIYQQLSDLAIERFVLRAKDRLKNNKDITDAERDAFTEAILESIADELQSRGWGRHTIHRDVDKGVIKGYKEEGGKDIFYSYITGMAGMLTKQDAAFDYYQALSNANKAEVPGRTYNYMQRYVEDMLRNTSVLDRIGGKFRAIAFAWYLMGNLKSATVQFSQNYVTGIPFLARRLKEMGVKVPLKAEYLYHQAMKDVAFSRYSEEERKLIDELFEEGITAAQFLREIKGKLKNKFSSSYDKTVEVLSIPFAGMETFNRKSAGLAMFRAMRKAGKSYEEAKELAESYIYDVHYLMGKANLPQAMRGEGGAASIMRTGYTFRSYQHNYLSSLISSVRSGKGFGRVDVVGRSLAYLVLFGGLSSVPFWDDLLEILEKRTGVAYRSKIRAAMRGIGGKLLEKFGQAGIPGLLGVDLSGSLKIGVPFREGLAKESYGVYGGIAKKGAESIDALLDGKFLKSFEKASPVFAENMAKGFRHGTKGVKTSWGRTVFDEDNRPVVLTVPETLGQMAGFRPERVSRIQQEKRSVKNAVSYFTDKRDDILEDYREGGLGAIAKKRSQFNKDRVEYGFKSEVPAITLESLSRQRRAMRQPSKKERNILRELRD